jgi:hypothetical protein
LREREESEIVIGRKGAEIGKEMVRIGKRREGKGEERWQK